MTAALIAALKAAASQWRLLLLIAAVAASGWLLHAFGKIEYQRGRTEVQQKWDAVSASQSAAVSAQKASDATQAAQASIVYQKEKQDAQVIYRTIRQTVVRTVPARECIDADGVRNLNAAIRGALPASSASR